MGSLAIGIGDRGHPNTPSNSLNSDDDVMLQDPDYDVMLLLPWIPI